MTSSTNTTIKQHPNLKDLTGQTFGRLTVISLDPVRAKNGNTRWNCCCECGTTTTVQVDNLKSGHTQSCGCLGREAASARMSARNSALVGELNPSYRPVKDRFADFVAPADDNGCIEWLGARGHEEHGKFRVEGKTVLAHRFAYEQKHGEIPAGLICHHECQNPWCVNPDHITLLTPAAHRSLHAELNRELAVSA